MDVEDIGGFDHEIGPAAQAGRAQGRVDGTRGEDRRDRQTVEAEAAVAEDDQLRPAARRRDRVAGQAVEGIGQGAGPVAGRPRRVEAGDRAPDVAEEGREVGEERPLEADRPRAGRRTAEERRPPAELDSEVHDGALALGIDRRVRHLGEGLAEMVGGGTVDPAEARDRGVVAHAPERLVTLDGHRPDVEPGVLGVEPGQEPEARGGRRAVEHDRRVVVAGRRVDVGSPRRVVDRQPAQEVGLRLDVLEDEPADRVDEDQLARPEPAAPDGLLGRQRDRPRLRGDRDEPVAGHGDGDRAEAVPVGDRADPPAVAEDDRRGAVPRGDEAGGPPPQRGHVGVRRPAQAERLRDGREEGRAEIPAGGHEELEELVERLRVGARLTDERTGRGELGGRGPGRVGGPAANLRAVAADGVDLAVVGDRPERLRQSPGRQRVRRVALVEDGVADADARRQQVGIEVGEAGTCDEALVDDRPA